MKLRHFLPFIGFGLATADNATSKTTKKETYILLAYHVIIQLIFISILIHIAHATD